ncbi:hypothetical protein [Streptomyces lavendulocolor]|uniref:hypothetical protein n=1 Tax=Streptomyces lavendulocolor TaxID=67316 RepID=UPI003C303080
MTFVTIRVDLRHGQVLGAAGLPDAGFTTRVVTVEADAERTGFSGSLPILIAGRDPFAEPDAGSVAGLPDLPNPCRPGRSPSLDQLRKALEAAAGAG